MHFPQTCPCENFHTTIFLSFYFLSFPSFFLSFLSSLFIEEEERRDGEMKMNSIDNG
jgi:hypothetical protein